MGLRRLMETRAVSQASPHYAWERDFPSLGNGSKTASGKNVNQNNALTLIAVYSCVDLIAGISALPVDVFKKDKENRRVVADAPLWVNRPNRYQTPVTFWHQAIVSMALDGNVFILTLRNERGEVVELYVLPPREVEIHEPESIGDQTLYHFGGDVFDRSQVLHIPLFVQPGHQRGLSPIDVAREAVGLGLTAEEFGSRFFQQGTAMSGVIEHPGTPKADEATLLREMFRKTHAGTKNSHAVGVLTGGAVFKPITLSPEQAQFLETRRFQNHQIALMYHVPTYMVDPTVTSSWGSGIEEQGKGLIDYAWLPYMVRIEQAVTTYLLGPSKEFKFNLDAKLRPKTKERYDSYRVALESGFMCEDEVRALEDLPPLPDGLGQRFYRPANWIVQGEEVDPLALLEAQAKFKQAEKPADDEEKKPDEEPADEQPTQ